MSLSSSIPKRIATSPRWCAFFLVSWCGFLFFYGLAGPQLWRTENLRAIIAEGMLRSGNWIVPTLYGEPLFTKPPGMYVAIVLCSLPFGRVTELSARLPSALAASLTVILFYRLFSRQLGRLAGLIAAVILPMSLLYLDKGTAAEIDMLQVAWVMGAMLCLLRVVENAEEREARSASEGGFPRSRFGLPVLFWWLGALVCVAGGVLTKWTAPVFFYCTAVPLLWCRGRLRLLWSWPHLCAVGIGVGLVLAWVVAAVLSTGWEVFSTTVLAEALPRLVPGYVIQHHEHFPYWLEVLLHPFWLLATALPWSVVALWSLRPGFARLWDDKGRRLLAFFHCWTWPNLVFWTLMPDHTPRHCSPMFPGLGGLAAMVCWAWFKGILALPWRRISPARFLTGTLALFMAAKVVFVEAIMPHRNALREPRAKGSLLASLIPASSCLYLVRVKDEGIMFYFGGTVIRLKSFADLPSSPEPMYGILDTTELQQWSQSREMDVVQHLTDEQGKPIFLVRVLR
jgi:4-amino-4-deoxy-L-arabinose transferase-like glycosyltransferase